VSEADGVVRGAGSDLAVVGGDAGDLLHALAHQRPLAARVVERQQVGVAHDAVDLLRLHAEAMGETGAGPRLPGGAPLEGGERQEGQTEQDGGRGERAVLAQLLAQR
jgi:hypothetical protein